MTTIKEKALKAKSSSTTGKGKGTKGKEQFDDWNMLKQMGKGKDGNGVYPETVSGSEDLSDDGPHSDERSTFKGFFPGTHAVPQLG